MTRILGLDPGIGLCGYGVLEVFNGKLHARAYGVLSTPVGAPVPYRLAEIYRDMNLILAKFQPQEAAIEIFWGKGLTNTANVFMARGVVMMALGQAKIGIAEYQPNAVKLALTGNGRAEKKEIGEAVRDLLGLPTIPRPDDAADALAIAIMHAQHLFPSAILHPTLKGSP